jgi:hypothetical protein
MVGIGSGRYVLYIAVQMYSIIQWNLAKKINSFYKTASLYYIIRPNCRMEIITSGSPMAASKPAETNTRSGANWNQDMYNFQYIFNLNILSMRQ